MADSEQDDQEFDLLIEKAIKAMGAEVKAQSERRQDDVMKRLEQEMARLRPHKERLLGNIETHS